MTRATTRPNDEDRAGSLEGILVLDFSRILAGPYCAMQLGDLGASVLKVESPKGDDCRHWGPPFEEGESAYFLAVNRNKKSLCLDLKQEEGLEVARALVARADVVLENFRPGTMERLGLGYDECRKANPAVVYCSISGYGQTGPLKDKPGYDAVMQGEGGWMALTGEPDGMPMKVGASLADILTGMMAAEGILAALFRRERTGRGERIDVALFDSVLATLCYQAQGFLMTGRSPRRLGNRHSSLTPYETFETEDSHVIIGVGNDALWKKFCALVDASLDEPRFERNADRVRLYDELRPRLEALFRSRPTSSWIEVLDSAGIPVGRVRTVEEVFENPQVEARSMRIQVDHSKLGRLPLTGNPIKMGEGSAGTSTLPPPLLGEHTESVLREFLGYSEEAIRSLREKGVVGA